LALKATKKRVFLAAGRSLRLWSNVSWHATSAAEFQVISHFAGSTSVFLARPISDGVDNPTDAPPPRSSGILKLLFASRISRKKNLDFALRVLAATDRRIDLTIAAPAEDEQYWSECERLITNLPGRVNVRVLGGLSREELDREYRRHDALLLPTRSENFGHVIAEALARGLPVVISDQTIFKSIDSANAGWDLALGSVEPWVAALRVLADEASSERALRRHSVLRYARLHLDNSAAVGATEMMFQRAMTPA